jgi:hypothetical protein
MNSIVTQSSTGEDLDGGEKLRTSRATQIPCGEVGFGYRLETTKQTLTADSGR